MKQAFHIPFLCFCNVILSTALLAGPHPCLLLNRADALQIRNELEKYSLLHQSFIEIKNAADKALSEKIDVPVPTDPAGGYTHEKHKNNYTAMCNAGLIYVVTNERKYADYTGQMLLQYARLIPTLKNHPESRGSSPGRLFHQALNDANWLLYSALAYDCVYDALTAEERIKIENGAFRPLCNYFTHDLKDWFNLIHNHGVWACAAVGITGLVIGDDEMVQQAMKGTERNGKGGLFAQLNNLFSPDGYYTEGPYYGRYALLPFYLFAQALNNRKPELKIFDYRNRILQKALDAVLQQTNTDGKFFPINDAIKDKDYTSSELVVAASIAYGVYRPYVTPLFIAEKQKKVMLSGYGLKLAEDFENNKDKSLFFPYKTVEYTDGAKGDQGGISIIRAGNERNPTTLLLKYTSHGLSHGHYDRLNMVLYDDGKEIFTDYGSARFLNVEQKEGGRYLPENKSFAVQTVAHNTVVVDEISHYNIKESEAEKYHPVKWFSSFSNTVQAVSALESHAYKNVILHRTLISITDKNENPVIIDLYHLSSPVSHQYDLPFWYSGQFIGTDFNYQAYLTSQSIMGTANGYQHIWKEAEGKTDKGIASFTLLNGGSFYSVSTLADTSTELYFIRSGASDPNFNLRREPGFMIRKHGSDPLFVNVIEKHGSFNNVTETAFGSKPGVGKIEVLTDNEDFTAVAIRSDRHQYLVAISNKDNNDRTPHLLTIGGKPVQWRGPFYFLETSINNNKN